MSGQSPALPLRVAQVVRPAEGGIRRHVSLLTATLSRTEFKSTVYAPSAFTLEAVGGVVAANVIPVDIAPVTSAGRDMRAIIALARCLRGTADIVHAHGLRAAFIGVSAAKLAGIPVVFTAHNVPPRPGRLQKLIVSLISAQSDAIITVSEAIAQQFVELGCAKSKLHVIPNGIQLARYSGVVPGERAALGVREDDPVVIYVGRLSPEKGVRVLLDAFTLVKKSIPTVQLLIVGSGPDEAELRSSALKTRSDIHFTGNRDDVPQLMAAADVVAIPSFTEGQGIVAIEAMASGIPVVASRVGGLVETIQDGVTGMLVSPHSAQELATAIETLLLDDEGAKRMAAAGSRRAASFTIEAMVEAIQKVYLTMVLR